MATMTLQDVADLAKVRRPVVSMWRKRPVVRGVSMPFPSPVRSESGIERFDRDEIVGWLGQTGRGNNPESDLDAPTLAVPDGADLADALTLLCWRVASGEEAEATSRRERIAIARSVDPDDSFLLREISELRPSDGLLRFVDDLVAGSLGPADALDRLERGRLKRELGERGFAGDAGRLVRAVVGACVDHIGRDAVSLIVNGVCHALDLIDLFDHHLLGKERELRRRAAITGLAFEAPKVAARLTATSLTGIGVPEALDRIDTLVVDLDVGDIAVVIGPAAALSDSLAGQLEAERSRTLRVENLVAALRLPRGLWRAAPRQNLALWVCVGGASVREPLIADIAGVTDLVLADLAFDIAAGMAGSARAFRYLRPIGLESVLAGGPLVPVGALAQHLRTDESRAFVDRVHSATLVTSAGVGPIDVLVAPTPGGIVVAHRSLAELRALGHLTCKRGNRIDPALASDAGTVAVLPDAGFMLDPFDAARRYPRALRTEPGDVVFVAKPHPAAWVDTVGGALVASPARVIRLLPAAEFGPRLLATVINHTAAAGTDWESWRVPVVRGESERLETALAEADRFEDELRQRLSATHELKNALIEGVAAGALTLEVGKGL